MRQKIGRASAVCAALLASAAASAQGLASMSRGWVFQEEGGAALFANVCAACHQPDAEGAAGAGAYPALAGNANLASAGYLEILLFDGRRGMPPLGYMMSDQQAADVINYVRTHFGNAYRDELSAADVESARPACESGAMRRHPRGTRGSRASRDSSIGQGFACARGSPSGEPRVVTHRDPRFPCGW